MLQSDPFEVEVGTEQQVESFVLEPIDRTKDVPNSWKGLRRAMELMGQNEAGAVDAGAARKKAKERGKVGKDRPAQETQTEVEESASEVARKNEFDNLVPLLTGLRIAGRRWKSWQWEIIARTAGQNSAVYALLDAARQAEKTGLYLYDLRVIREVLWACRSYVANDNWSPASCEKALRYVEEFTRLMEDPMQWREKEKAMRKKTLDESHNPLRQADVIGIVVELAAKRVEALKITGAEEMVIAEAQKTLSDYLDRLLPNISSTFDESSKAVAEAKPLGMVADYELLRWVPVLNGLKTVQKLGLRDNDNFTEQVESLLKKVDDAKSAVVDNVGGDEGGRRRGLIWCNAAQVV